MLYELIPNMPEIRLKPLVERFSQYISTLVSQRCQRGLAYVHDMT
jgi:hypothetical protein